MLFVELRRLLSRRAVILLLLGSLLATGVVAAALLWNTRPVSPAEREQAQQRAEAMADSPRVQRDLERCREDPEQLLGPGTTAAECERAVVPRAEWFLQRSPLSLDRARDGAGIAVTAIVVALLVLLGATFAGADWSSGSLSNQLLFTPERWRVWLAKTGVVFLGSLAAAAVMLAAFWLLLLVVAQARGIDTSASVQSATAWMVARSALLAGGGAAGGFALTMLLRRTAGTLGLLFAYAVGGQLLLTALPIEGAGRWSLGNNVLAWVRDGYTYLDPSLRCSPGERCDQQVTLGLEEGATYLGVLLVVVLVVSLLDFRRRDVA